MSERQALAKILAEKDQWIRACGRFAMEPISKEKLMETNTGYSIMEHVLLLRRVPLLAVLPLTDLQRVAGIASERNFTDGEVICEEGEPGDELYVIVSGAVLVLVKQHDGTQKEIARRKAGDVVGEMSIITGDNRNATLVASGDIHVLSLDRLNFESLMRERPEVSLAIMRQLCNRLKQLSHWE
jgi:CRP-like cAMP-binding protein